MASLLSSSTSPHPSGLSSSHEVAEKASHTPATEQPALEQTVLIVDDDSAFRATAAMMLESHGFKTAGASNGLEALCLLERNPQITAILLDLLMPVMNGEETFRQLRSFWANIPVIVMSGFDLGEIGQRFGEPAPDGFVQKPFNFAKLAGTLGGVLR